MRLIRQALIVAAAAAACAGAQASLVGVTVGCAIASAGDFACAPPNAMVDAGAEFSMVFVNDAILEVDIGAASIRVATLPILDFLSSTASISLTLSSLDSSLGPIIGIANFATVGTTGIDASDVTFTGNSVQIELGGSPSLQTDWLAGSFLQFDLVFASAVPEPATLALAAIALGGLAAARRRRRL